MKQRLFTIITTLFAIIFAITASSCSVEQEPVLPSYYSVSYSAGTGGTIEGKTTQTVEKGKNGESVTAVPDKCYEFVDWSDGVTEPTRYEQNVASNLKLSARFRSIIRTYSLNYKFGSADNKLTKVTFNYPKFEPVTFPVPTREHFTFGGWYCGETQVTDADGKMVIGEDLSKVNDTEIYAKWIANEIFTYKILLVYVTRVDATLPTRDQKSKIHVDYTMSELEREFYELTTVKLEQILDDMLDGLVDFQIDDYFTTETVLTENFRQGGVGEGMINNGLFPNQIPEVIEKLDDYDSVLSVFCMNDYEYPFKLHDASGAGGAKYGEINFDSFLSLLRGYKYTMEEAVERLKNNQDFDLWGRNFLENYWFETFIHELAHTIEQRVNLYSYHKSASSYNFWLECNKDYILANKLYYLQAIEKDGQKVGIPYGFWAREIATVKYYSPYITNGHCGGIISSSRLGASEPAGSANKRFEVVYGDSVTVTAVPDKGYEFVQWSDGVTTAERTDIITGDFEVTAIFEPIEFELTVASTIGGHVDSGYYSGGNAEGIYSMQIDGKKLRLVPVADEGYRFVGWSNNETEDMITFSIDVLNVKLFDENNKYTLTAIFEKID